MKQRTRAAVVGGAIGGLLFFSAVPALANVTKDGTQRCTGTNSQSWVQSKTSGSAMVTAPGGIHYSYLDGLITTHKSYGTIGGGYWKVDVSGGSLNDAGTFAGCERP